MALIVVLAIYTSSGRLEQGADRRRDLRVRRHRVVMMRVATLVLGVNIRQPSQSDEYRYEDIDGGRRAVRAGHGGGVRDPLICDELVNSLRALSLSDANGASMTSATSWVSFVAVGSRVRHADLRDDAPIADPVPDVPPTMRQ